MPFKLPFSKTRHYNVVSRSVLVVCVKLLDSSTLECTLSADSTGQHCLQNVAQRIGLGQPEFFGLRYMSKRPYPKVRWVELDRPLKKQLDKFAQSPHLTLSVLYYIHDVGLLHDDTTRSHFFLQVKQDVLDGKLRCNYEQAVLLASYSLQAEFGDHQPDRHTPEYLRDFVVMPKLPSLSEPEVTVLLELAVWQYASLRGLAQALAETYYILEAQRLEGYGQETFMARDERGSEVYLGASLVGVTVRPASGHSVTTLRWNDISNLVNLKRAFAIECPKSSRTFQFTFDEPDAAKYIWKMCVKQHTFFKRNQELLERSMGEAASEGEGETGAAAGGGKVSVRGLTIPDLQQSVMTASAASQLLDPEQLSYHQTGRKQDPQQQYMMQSHHNVSLAYVSNPHSAPGHHQDHILVQENRSNRAAANTTNGLYGGCTNTGNNTTAAQDYYESHLTSDVGVTAINSGGLSAAHRANTTTNNHAVFSGASREEAAPQLKQLDASNPSLYLPPDLLHSTDLLYHARPPPGNLSSLHLQQQQHYLLYNSNPNLPAMREFNQSFRRALLPEYRQAPDYHSVCRAVSQRASAVSSAADGRPGGAGAVGRGVFPLHSTYSTPDLQTASAHDSAQGAQQLREDGDVVQHYRPPPPYPGVRQHHLLVQQQRPAPHTKSTSSSSPDLVAAAAAAAAAATTAPPAHFGTGDSIGGSWSHIPSTPQPHAAASGARELSRTYENLCDLDDVVLSLRNHMAGNSTNQFLHSFSSLSALNDTGSHDCLSGAAVYRLQHSSRDGQTPDTDEAEPIYQNVLAYSPQQQPPKQNKCMVYNQDQLQKLLDHQDHLQQQQKQDQQQQQQQLQQQHQQQQQQLQAAAHQRPAYSGAATGTTAAMVHRSAMQNASTHQSTTASPHWGAGDHAQPHTGSHLAAPQPEKTSLMTNPLSSSVDSTKSSPMIGSSLYVTSGPVRPSESLNDITFSATSNIPFGASSQGSAKNLNDNSSVNANLVAMTSNHTGGIPLSVSSVDIPSKVASCNTNTAIISLPRERIGSLHVSVVSSAAEETQHSEGDVGESSEKISSEASASTASQGAAAKEPVSVLQPVKPFITTPRGAGALASNNSSSQSASSQVKVSNSSHDQNKERGNDERIHDTDTRSSTNTANEGATLTSTTAATSNVSHNSSMLSRIYATRDPRARVLQNELLSAELPIKFSGIALAKTGAVYVSERGTVTDAQSAQQQFLPYADNRVRLQPCAENKTGYVNASHVTATSGQSRQVFYMVQALGTEDTVDVWRCIWQHDVRVVVLMASCPAHLQTADSKRAPKASRLLSSLSQRRGMRQKRDKHQQQQEEEEKQEEHEGDSSLTAQGRRKDPLGSVSCCPYWPQFDNTSLECGSFRIYRRHSTRCVGYTMTRLEVLLLQRSGSGRAVRRTVWHIQYEHGLTNTSSFIELVEQMSSLREMSQQEAIDEVDSPVLNRNVPVLLQSPRGSEHCGAVMLCDLMIGAASDAVPPPSDTASMRAGLANDSVTDPAMGAAGGLFTYAFSLSKSLHHLRQQRANLVPDYEMFKFVYRVMIEYFGRSRLI